MNHSRESIILLGGGGHAKVLIDLILQGESFQVIGILDPDLVIGHHIKGIKVLGSDAGLVGIQEQGVKHAAVAIGSVHSNQLREKLFNQCRDLGFQQPALIHPRAFLASDVTLCEGVQVMAGAIVQTDTIIGEGVVVNTGSRIDHDCKISKHSFLAPGVILCGGVSVGENAFLGAGSVVIQGVKIGKNAVIAAGAVVTRDVRDGALVKGVPAK
ncbi:acetyltransferase [Gimesia algae]|uniref:Acetyltransferase EpsM n=1 Tax=Gimesia algae TaxID=2527971 RepID=A0A517VAT8_9PLAN|nr:acetyltransferase [Gimesia algae]QDT90108.1 Putative acetyltransferase EpsM [Gimesia algae]